MTKRTLAIRADASSQIGSGHLMRCLALGQAWQEAGGTVVFITACESAPLRQRLLDEGFAVRVLENPYPSLDDWKLAQAILGEYSDPWLVLDGYHFDANYQQTVKEAGYRLLVVDDYGQADHYSADVVLNQNIYADEELYRHREPYARLLLGTRYALLRREFWSWCGWRRNIPEVAHRILVTLGDSDPANVALKVTRALQHDPAEDIEAVLVVGSNNQHYEQLRAEAGDAAPSIQLIREVVNMPKLMAWADVAISAGGSTSWELVFMGLPHLVILQATNQIAVGDGLAGAGVAENLGWHEKASVAAIANALRSLQESKEQRSSMADRARKLIDGEGQRRAVDQMLSSFE